jgi:hypothetical protein
MRIFLFEKRRERETRAKRMRNNEKKNKKE